MSAIALLSAQGREDRLDVAAPTALFSTQGIPLVVRAVRGLSSSNRVRHIVVMASQSSVDAMRLALDWPGMSTRVIATESRDHVESLRLGLCAALDDVPEARVVLVHDAARAFTPPELVRSVVAEVEGGAKAVVPVLPLVDTVKRVEGTGRVVGTLERSSLRVLQTPQGFQVEVLRAACQSKSSAPTGLLNRLNVPVTAIPGHPDARRISTPLDLAVAEAVLSQREPSTHETPHHHQLSGQVPMSGRRAP